MSKRSENLAARRQFEIRGFEPHTIRPDLELEVYTKTLESGSIEAKCFIGKAGKPKWYYLIRASQAHQLPDLIEQEIGRRERSLESKAKAKAERSAPVTGIKVGDVFRSMWGYDQTNVDYYQVTRVLPSGKSVEIRKIAAIAWEEGMMQGRSVPALDEFVGPAKVKRLRKCGLDGGAAVSITSFYDAYLMEPVIEGVPAYASSHWTAYA